MWEAKFFNRSISARRVGSNGTISERCWACKNISSVIMGQKHFLFKLTVLSFGTFGTVQSNSALRPKLSPTSFAM
jgi:hypothetical protein